MGNTLLLSLLASFMCAGYSSGQVQSKPVPEDELIPSEALDKAPSKEERPVVDD